MARKMVAAPWIPALSVLQARLMGRFYRTVYLAAATQCGLLDLLGSSPASADVIAERLGWEGDDEVLQAWLGLGVKTGVLRIEGHDRFALKGLDAKLLARDNTGVARAGLLEVVLYHQQAIQAAPDIARTGLSELTLADQDAAVIARSTRLVQPLIESAAARVLAEHRPRTWLEVGAGDGHYAAFVAARSDHLRVTCLELQGSLAEAMTRRFERLPHADRLSVICGDVRDLDSSDRYDVITLHNLLYYFEPQEQVQIMSECRRRLEPGGVLVVTTSTPDGPTPVSALDLWFRCSEFGSGLPSERELTERLVGAGFASPHTYRPLPMFSLVCAVAHSA